MTVRECMSADVISVLAEESASSAAKLMARHNVGSLPVRSRDGHLIGMVTDRDLVVRCLAAGEEPSTLAVQDIMTSRLSWAAPDESAEAAAERMALEQVRRLPVVENGRLVGMLTLADLSRRRDYAMEAARCLTEISRNVKRR